MGGAFEFRDLLLGGCYLLILVCSGFLGLFCTVGGVQTAGCAGCGGLI